MTEVLGIIPARGGSKAIPRKNIVPLCGRPLIAYTITAALQSRSLTRIVVSTDDEDIAETCRLLGVEVPFLRPPAISADDTPMIDVLQHTLKQLEAGQGYDPTAIVLLQPTSPLRTHNNIDEAVGLFFQHMPDSVVSVVAVPHQFSPSSVMKIVDGRLTNYLSGGQMLRRQDKPVTYARNGPAILVRRSAGLSTGQLYGENSLPYIMNAIDSVDIDSMEDLVLAECLFARRTSS